MEDNTNNPLNKVLKENDRRNRMVLIFAAAGFVIFLLIILTVSFKGKFGLIFPKPFSRAFFETLK